MSGEPPILKGIFSILSCKLCISQIYSLVLNAYYISQLNAHTLNLLPKNTERRFRSEPHRPHHNFEEDQQLIEGLFF